MLKIERRAPSSTSALGVWWRGRLSGPEILVRTAVASSKIASHTFLSMLLSILPQPPILDMN